MEKTLLVCILIFSVGSWAQVPPPPPPKSKRRLPPPPPPGSPHRKVVAKKKMVKAAPMEVQQKEEKLPEMESLEEVKLPAEDKTIIEHNVPIESGKGFEEKIEKVEADKKKDKKKSVSVKKVKKKLVVKKKKKIKKKNRKTASVGRFKGGMHKFASKCTMRAKPSGKSKAMGTVRAGKKLWVDAHNKNWRKAYKKSGTVFVHRNCF